VEEQQPKKISSAHESLLQLSEPANLFNNLKSHRHKGKIKNMIFQKKYQINDQLDELYILRPLILNYLWKKKKRCDDGD
jgi:hypothetical protein